MSKLKAAVIGCGGVSRAHARGYMNIDNVELIAAADIYPESVARFGEEFNLDRLYTDYREMLSKESPDIVSICTGPTLHAEITAAAAEYPVKGILCEKPMTFHYGESARMHELCAAKGIMLNINHQRRYEYEYVEARRAVERGDIGELIRTEAWVGDGWDLLSWGTHWVDMHRFYNGGADVVEVFAQADIRKRFSRYQHPVEDQIMLQMKFANGVVGQIDLVPDPIPPGNRLIGTKGIIHISPEGQDGVMRMVNERGLVELTRPAEAKDGFQLSIEALVERVLTGQPSGTDSADALVVMQVIMAAYESARTHQPVKLPFTPEQNPLQAWFEEGGSK